MVSAFPEEDQTDEDFFNMLVEDDLGVTESQNDPVTELALSNNGTADDGRQLEEDFGDTGLVVESEDDPDNKILQVSHVLKDRHLIIEGGTAVQSPHPVIVAGEAEPLSCGEKTINSYSSLLSMDKVESVDMNYEAIPSASSSMGKSVGSKSSGIKEVQWSAFYVNSKRFSSDEVDAFSDFLIENSDDSINQMNMNSDLKSSFVDKEVSSHGLNLISSEQHEAKLHHSGNEQDPKRWENLYPGWKFDTSTGQWYQVDDYDTTMNPMPHNDESANSNMQETSTSGQQGDGTGFISSKNMEISYSQQRQSTMIASAEDFKTNTLCNWNQDSHGTTRYPHNMVFDPQYPGWYYDTNFQQWFTLESYTQSIQQETNSIQRMQNREINIDNRNVGEGSLSSYCNAGPMERKGVLGQVNRDKTCSWGILAHNIAQHSIEQSDANNYEIMGFSGKQHATHFRDEKVNEMNYLPQHVGINSWDTIPSNSYSSSNGSAGFQTCAPVESMQQFIQPMAERSLQSHSISRFNDDKSVDYCNQQFHGANTSYQHFSSSSNERRSSAGRPPHALVTFGFGGKLIFMKTSNSFNMKVGNTEQESSTAAVSILNLMEVVKDQANTVCNYFHHLCQQSFPGPLVGGIAAMRDVYKWIEENITNFDSPIIEPKKGRMDKLLLSLLKISCKHYGKLRSPFGSGPSFEEHDGPESAITKLFGSDRANGDRPAEFSSYAHCIQIIPSQDDSQTSAIEMQNLLVSGKSKEALQCAQAGQLWGPALVLAAQLGEKFYVDTVKQMAQCLLVSGSPLRTLCLLIAGQPAYVFSTENSFGKSSFGTTNGDVRLAQLQSNSMLDTWEENLAIITANRTKDDELVLIHLGDCLWKERGEVTAAHICYLVAEANFEQYSDIARLCLIGANHWNYPRTYASPDAIQRTELYEYSKVLGNSQFVLLPFQPYKLIYATMLAEIGKLSDSLRYCQAAVKVLRNSGRTPEIEMWKSLFSSLEERLRAHQQGGYSEALAPAKLVGKLFTSIDRSIHRVMGTPSLPPVPQNSANGKECSPVTPRFANSQSTLAMSSLIPSASVEHMSEWTSDGGRKNLHSRSISEPDFGRTPKQDGPNDTHAGNAHSITPPSRFGRIGSQLFQKTMGWVSRSRSDRQAKLGESNRFYYDEKLKRWVEEGVEPPAVESILPPPPKAVSFSNGAAEYNINDALTTQIPAPDVGLDTKPSIPLENSGIPPMSPSPNQFSARGRMGVRSRYVDTFNNSCGQLASSFQSPSISTVKPAAGAKFFVPMAASPTDQVANAAEGGIPEAAANGDICTSTSTEHSSNSQTLLSASSSSSFPAKDNIDLYNDKETKIAAAASHNSNGNYSLSYSRAASWCGNLSSFSPSNAGAVHSNGSMHQVMSVDDLHEVGFS